jgi:hypothetical protein
MSLEEGGIPNQEGSKGNKEFARDTIESDIACTPFAPFLSALYHCTGRLWLSIFFPLALHQLLTLVGIGYAAIQQHSQQVQQQCLATMHYLRSVIVAKFSVHEHCKHRTQVCVSQNPDLA